MQPLRHDILTATELKEKKCAIEVRLAGNGRAEVYVKITGEANIYIVRRKGKEDFWTFNESQAVAEFNKK